MYRTQLHDGIILHSCLRWCFVDFVVVFRCCTSLISSLTKTKTTLWRSTRNCWALLNARLSPDCFRLRQRRRPNRPSSLPLELALRSALHFFFFIFLSVSLLSMADRSPLCFFLLPMLQQQLQALMDTLNSTEPHYIRCVKPNNVLKPAIFENVNVMQQLRCGVSDLGKLGDYVLCIWQKTAWLYLMQSVIRVCLRPSGSVVPGTRRAARSTSFCIVSEYLRLRPSKGSKSATELVFILYFFPQ